MSTSNDTGAAMVTERPRVLVPAAMIREHNYRASYDDAHIGRLADDIARDGLQSAPMVRAMPDGTYRLVYGHCRSRAMIRVLGWEMVPVVIADDDMTDADEFSAQLRENELRRAVSKADRARAAARLRDQFGKDITEIAAIMNVSTTTARNWIRCAECLSDSAMADWSAEFLSDVQAYTLCRVNADRQAAVLALVRSDKYSVKAFDALISRVIIAQNEDAAGGMFDMSEFTMAVQQMGEDAKQAATDARAAAKAAREATADVLGELAELRRLMWEAQRTLRKANPALANRCARALATAPTIAAA